jgi:Transposase IS4/DDE_Tnp_1-like zinc-ribbon
MINNFNPHSMKLVPMKHPKNTTREKPETVILYNQFMGGVDRVDQVLTPYSTARKSIKWYKKMFFHLIDICIYNSKCIYEHTRKTKISYKDFLLMLVKDIMSECPPERRQRGRPQMNAVDDDRLRGNHFPGWGSKSDCTLCRRKGMRSATRIICQTCQVHVCLTKNKNCFSEFHTKVDLPPFPSSNSERAPKRPRLQELPAPAEDSDSD